MTSKYDKFCFVIGTFFAKLALVVAENIESGTTWYTRCYATYECCSENRECCKKPAEEEKMPTVTIVGIALGSLFLVCIIVAIVTAVVCSSSKRSRRVGTVSRRGNAEVQLRLPSTSIRQPPPYELSGYAPPSYPGTRSNTNETAVLTQNMPMYKF